MVVLLKTIMLWLILSLLYACSDSSHDSDSPDTLRIVVLPDQSKDLLYQRYNPLIEYLSHQTGMKFELVVAKSYEDSLQLFLDKKVELARFGGVTFAQAHLKNQATPLVMRDIDIRFYSYYLVKADSNAKSIEDFKGKNFGFGSRLSTSGHLMPRYFLEHRNIIPEKYFSSVSYSGAHDVTANWVITGKIDIGVANAIVIDNLYKKNIISKDKIKILAKTPPYADYVWTAQKSLPEKIKNTITTAFLMLDKNNTEHAEILEKLNANHFLPANSDDFSKLEEIIIKLGYEN